MIGDPYEEADNQQRLDDAKLVTPTPARRDRKIFVVGMVLAGVLLGLIILANIAGLVTGRGTPNARPIPKPVTMTKAQSDSFAQQQSGQADYMRGMDRDRKMQNTEDTILGHSSGLAGAEGDPYDEADGVPRKTRAQDDAEHGRNGGAGKPEAQQRYERAALLAEHRRQNDIDSSPVSVDFSEYFAKEKEAAVPVIAKSEPQVEARPTHRRSPLAEALNEEEGQSGETENASATKAHDPKQDYEFDSADGKLYRLMEDTILETVLVNRLTGASVGPAITMITTDVYSMNGARVLIPKETRLLGRVSAVASLNQGRLFVAFHRMIMPDGYSVSLDKFQGLDVVGQTGLRDLVNHHYVRIFGASLALAAIAATAQIGNNASFGTYDWGVQMRSGISQGMGQSAQRVMERFMNTLPTFTIRERARVKIMLSGDLLLPDIKNHSMDPDL
jgi:type IV secretory pathway VirB10-like protein